MRILMAANVPKIIPSGIQRQTDNIADQMKELGHEVYCVFAKDVILPLTSYPHHSLFGAIEFPILLVRKFMSLKREKGQFDIVEVVGKDG